VERLVSQQRDRQDELWEAAMQWEAEASGVFVAGYQAATAGLASVPPTGAAFDRLLQLFLIEKALYEMRYELESRPQWTAIPIRGLIGLLDGGAAA
jgi:maltose alpha-D-glucosyltransferase/alpha-amylase